MQSVIIFGTLVAVVTKLYVTLEGGLADHKLTSTADAEAIKYDDNEIAASTVNSRCMLFEKTAKLERVLLSERRMYSKGSGAYERLL